MKTVKQMYTRIPPGAIRITIIELNGYPVILQTTTKAEFKFLRGLSMYKGAPEGRDYDRLQRSQPSQASCTAQGTAGIT